MSKGWIGCGVLVVIALGLAHLRGRHVQPLGRAR